MVQILFGSPIRKETFSNLSITFPFTIMVTYSGAEKDKKFTNFINIIVTSTQLARWGYNKNDIDNDIDKVLFEFALREIKSKTLEELLNEKLELTLHYDNQSKDQPFDPTKIPNPNGYALTLDNSKLKPKMGF